MMGKIAPIANSKIPSLFLRSKTDAFARNPLRHSLQVNFTTDGKNKIQGKHQQAVMAK